MFFVAVLKGWAVSYERGLLDRVAGAAREQRRDGREGHSARDFFAGVHRQALAHRRSRRSECVSSSSFFSFYSRPGDEGYKKSTGLKYELSSDSLSIPLVRVCMCVCVTEKEREREREEGRERERERQTDRQTERVRERETDRQIQSEGERERERESS